MPAKQTKAATKAEPAAKKEAARPAKKAAPRVTAAKHRTVRAKAAPEESGEQSAARSDDREIIAAIAYGYWESRGRQGGDPFEDWVRAEREYRTAQAAAL